ncbi:MAG: YceD family protein [Gammaproteobacteria bacterium]|nr:YceD family protein [Gammaproteobacteria bacterium]
MSSFDSIEFFRYSRGFMSSRLPVEIDPYQLAAQNASLEGQLAVEKFKRFSNALATQTGQVRISLLFYSTGDGDCCVSGYCEADVQLICQRCLMDFDYPLKAEIRLGFVGNESLVEKLPDGFEPYVFDVRKKIHLIDLMEDELLLKLPMTPSHVGVGECDPEIIDYIAARESKVETDKQENPFAVLKTLQKL